MNTDLENHFCVTNRSFSCYLQESKQCRIDRLQAECSATISQETYTNLKSELAEAQSANGKLKIQVEQCKLALKQAKDKANAQADQLAALYTEKKECRKSKTVPPYKVITAPVEFGDQVSQTSL